MSYWALIGTNDLVNGAVTTAKIAAGAVTSTEIANDTIVDADINSAAAIAYSKLNLTGSIVPADFDASVTLDDFTAAGTVDMNSNQFSNLPAATASGEAVEYSQFVGALDGLSYKEQVVVASTADIDLATGGLLTIDGVTLSAGDRVLVKDQTDATENGIYEAAVGSWTRADDANTVDELQDGATTWVKQGSTQNDTRWTQTETLATLGSDDVLFAQTGSATAVTELSDLSDVDTTGAADGSLLRYEASAGEWQVASGSFINDNGRLDLTGSGITSGIYMNGGDLHIYSNGAGVGVTPGSWQVGSELQVTSRSQLLGGLRQELDTISANTTLSVLSDNMKLVDTSGGSVTVTLPTSHNRGTTFQIKRNGANDVIIDTPDADTIDGAASYTIDVDLRAVTVVSDGANWYIF